MTERGRDRDRKRSDREERMGGDGGGGCDRRRVLTGREKKNPRRGEKMQEKRVRVQRGKGGRKRRKKEMLAEVERTTGGEVEESCRWTV